MGAVLTKRRSGPFMGARSDQEAVRPHPGYRSGQEGTAYASIYNAKTRRFFYSPLLELSR